MNLYPYIPGGNHLTDDQKNALLATLKNEKMKAHLMDFVTYSRSEPESLTLTLLRNQMRGRKADNLHLNPNEI